ncbi:ABC transporter substrate-binding protein [Cobetia sp. Ld8]|uniref:ABC transporter substrate-binding protein n=1 Tax=Cobetia sp. Ld8 TaxID=649154 RepID=UPI003866FD10
MSVSTVRARQPQYGTQRLFALCCCLAISGLTNASSTSALPALNLSIVNVATTDAPLTPLDIQPSADTAGRLMNRGTQAAVSRQTLTATFVNPGLRGERFWDMVTDTMQAAALDLNITLEVVYAERNPYLLKKLAIQALESPASPDYLVLVNEEQAASELLTIADNHDTHVVMLLNGLTREQALTHGSPGTIHPSWIGSVIPDNHTAGKRMATQLIKVAREGSPTGQLHGLALIGDTRTPASIARNAGMVAGFAQDKAVQIDRILEARWNTRDAKRLTGQYLKWASRSSLGNDLVWAANDAMAEGAILALESAGLTPGVDVLVAGLNWSPEGISMVSNRRMLLTDGGHFMAGAWAMVMARDHADIEEWAPRSVNFPMSAITHDNVELYGPLLANPDWQTADFAAFGLQDSRDVYVFDPITVLTQMITHQDQASRLSPHAPSALKKIARSSELMPPPQ